MRGAVLHGLVRGLPDLDPLEDIVMRRSYGMELSEVFDPTKHPHYRQYRDETDGKLRCRVMYWFVKQVP
jgi:hypothetical protein